MWRKSQADLSRTEALVWIDTLVDGMVERGMSRKDAWDHIVKVLWRDRLENNK